ncbi:aldose epimerase family protein [Epilithonimonas lactis]|uniref:aldose epimerase family protein n=1 Tax=Epilithonimonas lactis TaxID=421072 RepID=UPI00068EEC67|nr:aldose epimerase family protein [Epilithonimonas lactis]SER08186.1 aldose 1-epimerase [Epilithonimonas lactis]
MENREINLTQTTSNTVEVSNFGITKDGQTINCYTLKNKNGMCVEIIDLGGIITSLLAPDQNGNWEDVVLGFVDPKDYLENEYYYGAIVGRYVNRISGGKFTIDGKEYFLNKNDKTNALHGGGQGFSHKIWDVEVLENTEFPTLKLSNFSKDGEQNFPGNLTTTVFYTLKEDNSLEITYEAQTDKTTVINLTQHSYFNLSGNFSEPIIDHKLQIYADKFLPINSNLVPTGERGKVHNTSFDFNNPKVIGEDISNNDEQLLIATGYDHTWIIDGSGLRKVASVYHERSGRLMEVSTTEPGLQFYSGNFLDGKFPNKSGGRNKMRTGFCLETQHFPNSPNQDDFPSTILRPGEKYSSKTIYKFSANNNLWKL